MDVFCECEWDPSCSWIENIRLLPFGCLRRSEIKWLMILHCWHALHSGRLKKLFLIRFDLFLTVSRTGISEKLYEHFPVC